MKRSTKLALSLVLAAGTAVPVMAQDNFPDAPANHWAYEALGKMKQEGLLVGYPDGLYRGNRPASRYELAVAMHAVYTHLRNLIDGLSQQLDALKSANAQDIQNLKDQIAHLQDEINAMKGWGDDIAALKRATQEFDKELKSLGVDVEAMKKDLGDLQERVTRLEKRKPAVDISGDIDFFAASSNSENKHPGLTQDGGLEGFTNGKPTGLVHDLQFLHEGAFTFKGTNDTGPQWKATIVVSDMFGPGGFGNQSALVGYSPSSTAENKEDVYIQDLSAKWDQKLVGLAFNAEVGRVAYSDNEYVLKRPANQSYFENERWDDGKYRFDGAILGFNFGAAKLHVYGGDTSGLTSVQGIEQNPWIIANTYSSGGNLPTLTGVASAMTVNQAIGADLTVGIGSNGHVAIQFLSLQDTEPTNSLIDNFADRLNVLGFSADYGIGRLKLSGAYHDTDLNNNSSAGQSFDNDEWNVKAEYKADKFGVWGGYRRIDDKYYAPGDWGRLGIIQNPANIEGVQAGGHLDITSALRLSATGEWDQGVNNEPLTGFFASPFGHDTHIEQYEARLDYRFNPNFSIYGGWEDTAFTGLAGTTVPTGDVKMDWTTVGVNYGLSSNAKFNIQYQFSNAVNGPDNAGSPLFSPFGTNRLTGGILTSQLTIKF